MSVLLQGGCYPSCGFMLEKQRIFTTAFVSGGFLSPTPLICVCLEGFGPVVLSSGLSGFLGLPVFVLSFFHPSLLFLLPSASRAKASGRMMSLRKESINTCPACQAKYLSLGVPPPYLLLSYSHPHPRILENRKCILLSDGWAPCSC